MTLIEVFAFLASFAVGLCIGFGLLMLGVPPFVVGCLGLCIMLASIWFG